MTAIYTYSEARQNFASLLDLAAREGEVRIQRRDGQTFVLRPAQVKRSPLDVEGIDLGLEGEEIIGLIQEGRRETGT
jgi:PHD/YefM family antitoxin component YafN of YafNO toxin-antitoxin module